MSSPDDQRIAYLTGEESASLPAHERMSLDELRAALSTRAMWEEPPPALERSIIAAIAEQSRARRSGTIAAPARRG